MSSLVQVYRAKPNPAGKDRSAHGPRPEQMNAEWVDIKNVVSLPISFDSVEIHHTQYGRTCSEVRGTERYWKGSRINDSFAPGDILRVHTGSRTYEHLLSSEDKGDIRWRAFAESSNFVLNNVCGDTISVFWLNQFGQLVRDSASYYSNPPEGRVLHRNGNLLS